MGLKILHTADWHLDSPFAGFTQEQRQYLKQEQAKLPQRIVELCRQEGCDLMLLAGDLFDGQPSRDTVQELKMTLAQAGVPVFIAPGNHDFCQPGSPWLEETWPDNVTVFTGNLESVVVESLDCRVYGAGFRGMDCPALLEDFQAAGEERYCVAVLHGDPTQVNSPYNPVTAAQVRNSGLDYLGLGHIHKAGAFRAGDTLCAWPGCPMGRGWDETGDKGVCIVTLDGPAQIQAVGLDGPRFLEEHVDAGADPAGAVEAVLPAAGNLDFYRVYLEGDGPVDVSQLHFPGFPNLEVVDHTQPPLEVWPDAGEDTLEGVYFHLLRQLMQEHPELENQVQLAALISRKLLSGREVTL